MGITLCITLDKSGVEQSDGSIRVREQGAPQGGVISPLLSNLYLHEAFDQWISSVYVNIPFERYADDIVIHCHSKEEAFLLLNELRARLKAYGLDLHSEKTKIVYCKNYERIEQYKPNSFTFLGFSFQPRTIKSKFGTDRIQVFSARMSVASKTHVRKSIREALRPRWSTQSLQWFAKVLNRKVRGWINYYGKFSKGEIYSVLSHLNVLIRKWLRNTYKLTSKQKVYAKYRLIQSVQPHLFYHWTLGIIT